MSFLCVKLDRAHTAYAHGTAAIHVAVTLAFLHISTPHLWHSQVSCVPLHCKASHSSVCPLQLWVVCRGKYHTSMMVHTSTCDRHICDGWGCGSVIIWAAPGIGVECLDLTFTYSCSDWLESEQHPHPTKIGQLTITASLGIQPTCMSEVVCCPLLL